MNEMGFVCLQIDGLQMNSWGLESCVMELAILGSVERGCRHETHSTTAESRAE